MCKVIIKKGSPSPGPSLWHVMMTVGLNSFQAIHYTLKDGTTFFPTSTTHIRQTMNQLATTPHIAMQQWMDMHNRNGDTNKLWCKTWCSGTSQAENKFSWQLIYGVPIALVYRNRRLRVSDATLCYTRCLLQPPEIIKHTIFECRAFEDIWEWIGLLVTALLDLPHLIHFTLLQVFLADPIHGSVPVLLWRILRKVCYFSIWNDRNEHYIPLPLKLWNKRAIICHFWFRFTIYIKKRMVHVTGQRRQMRRVYSINQWVLDMPSAPPL